ncbi:hypothetical protein FFWV33_18430 [Flavobacterium faecale]|uniref:DUF8201 domain-containing protein n=1 Tax=Flavobacterium faecale TaxID=1355330 RepID=A0A2S1LHV1_9FLAO|nr:hypothetical protein [Flavobacterium faecale]AWG23365.1 hypothetical protein FFWV33_18430 [Flavobacterium faecale]
MATLKVLKIQIDNFYFTAFFGLFGATVLASLWSLFGRLNIEFHIFLLVLNGLLLYFLWSDCKQLYTRFLHQIKNLNWPVQVLFAGFSIVLLAQSATAPFIVDNESYYIQTIKWLNEYGLVKGIANLHPFLAVSSGWHVTQAAFNFSFLYDRFNDLNGLCLWLLLGFAFDKYNVDLNKETKVLNFIGILPLLALFLFQFVSAPSPDLPIYCCTFLIVYIFFEKENYGYPQVFIITFVLAVFACYLKPTAVALVLFPFYILCTQFKTVKSVLLRMTVLGGLVLLLFISKNTIVSGYPFFPVVGFQFMSVDYAMPIPIAQFYFEQTKLVAFNCTSDQFASFSPVDRFYRWITLSGLHGFFNALAVLLLFIVPVIFGFFRKRKAIGVVYCIMTVQLVLLFFTSPQYRFFINFILVFILLFVVYYLKNKRILMALQFCSLFLVLIMLSNKIPLQSLSANPNFQTNRVFSIENLIYPHSNSSLGLSFERIQKGNLLYFSPHANSLFWEIGNASLPATNKYELAYFEQYFGYVPQMRTQDLADGFYAKKIK